MLSEWLVFAIKDCKKMSMNISQTAGELLDSRDRLRYNGAKATHELSAINNRLVEEINQLKANLNS